MATPKLIHGVATEQYAYNDIDLELAGAKEYFTVPVKVVGYWSYDPITLTVKRDRHGEWQVSLSRSSSGRDTGAVEDDLVAEVNFGVALMAAAVLGSLIRNGRDSLERGYQQARAAYEEREQTAKAADEPLTVKGASDLVMAALRMLATRRQVQLELYRRGEHAPISMWALRSLDDKIRFGFGELQRGRQNWGQVKLHTVIKNKELVSELAAYSARSHLTQED